MHEKSLSTMNHHSPMPYATSNLQRKTSLQCVGEDVETPHACCTCGNGAAAFESGLAAPQHISKSYYTTLQFHS